MRKCIICDENTSKPFQAFVEHFRFIDWEQRKWFLGTVKTFGFMSGITLMFPFLNTIVHWKYRKYRLVVEEEKIA